jgi:type IV pilus assembly protein PilY1
MNTTSGFRTKMHCLLLLCLLLLPAHARAASMNDYCIVPAFIGENVPANLLLMIDNSSSMYDLSYSDQGNADSSGTLTRQPYYCFDETYTSMACSNNSTVSCTPATAAANCGVGHSCNVYAGYFDSAAYYSYDFTLKQFNPVSALPATCNVAIANTLCLNYNASGKIDGTNGSGFAALGNYLNWLTASKFDVEKGILTGGKYTKKICSISQAGCSSNSDCPSPQTCGDGAVSFLEAESRGCVGQKFIKEALTRDFVNFTGTTDPNDAYKLGVTFAIRGPIDSANASAPSRGGQTFIEIFTGTYNNKLCQDAMTVWGSASANQNTVRTAVEACINYNSSGGNYCSGQPSIFCTTNANCLVTTQAVTGGCNNPSASACTTDADCGSVTVSGHCSNAPGTPCMADATCGVTTNAGTCSNKSSVSCLVDATCNFPPVIGGCTNAAAAGVQCNSANDCTVATAVGGCSNNGGLLCTADATCGTSTVLNSGKCSIKKHFWDVGPPSCTTNNDCVFAATNGNCSNDSSIECQSNPDCVFVPPGGEGRCSNDANLICSADVTCGSSIVPNSGRCSNSATTACTTNSNCTIAAASGKCSNNASLGCAVASDCTYASSAGACSHNSAIICTTDATCGTTAMPGGCTNVARSCTAAADCAVTQVLGTCSNNSALTCTSSAGCTYQSAPGKCSQDGTTSCTSDSGCRKPTTGITANGYCSIQHDASGSHDACDSNNDCIGNKTLADPRYGTCVLNTCTNPSPTVSTGTCNGYVPSSTGTCTNPVPWTRTNTCTNPTPVISTGTCTNPAPVPASSGTCTNPAPSYAGNHCNNPAPTISSGTCTNPSPTGAASGTCTNPAPTTVQNTCTNPAPVISTGTCTSPAPVPASVGVCTGITTTQNICDGASVTPYLCNSPPAIPYSSIDHGPCVNPTQSAAVKTKITYSHTIQTCWSYWKNGSFSNGDFQRLTNSCDEALAGWGICSGDNTTTCTGSGTPCGGALGTCVTGPTSIRPGNPALVCSQAYVGRFCTWNAATSSCTWNFSATSPSPDEVFAAFCDSQQPTVIDPTDSAASTGNVESVPAILSGVGVEAQLGAPVMSVPVKISTSTTPSGLIQQFGNRIRIGAMSFNFNGSASEFGVTGSGIATPKCCSNDTTRLCTMIEDCGGSACGSSYCVNKDGGTVIHPVGLGKCATMTTTTCATDSNCTLAAPTCINGFCGAKNSTDCATDAACSTGDHCISNGVGDHSSGLINTLDQIPANAWTPFAEAFYNVVGYFAVQKVCDNSATTPCKVDSDCSAGGRCSASSGKSRTDLRINSGDYNENLNPSQFVCQQNYSLLITDGSSTADQNPYVYHLAAPNSGTTMSNTAAGTCSYYAGSTYVPTISWLARNMNISNIPAPTAAANATMATVKPDQGRDSVTTYVVNTGGSNGLTGECNSVRLLTDTAANGGSTIKQANNPQELATSLQSVFEELAAKSASGTAASILSNSEGSGANILQAIFFPRKVFNSQTEAKWLGELNNLWYYVDPLIGKSSTREETVGLESGNYKLKLKSDYVLQFGFDNVKGTTTVKLLADTNGDGAGDANPGCVGTDPRCIRNPYPTLDLDPNAVYLDSPDSIKSLWKAGKQLWSRDLVSSPRTIYTPSASGLIKFSWATPNDNSAALATYLQYPGDTAGAVKLMKYVHGFDYPGDTAWRSRTVQIDNLPAAAVSIVSTDPYVTNPRDKGVGVWKLGDIISSTPRLQSTVRQNAYDLAKPSGYGDTSYGSAATHRGYIYNGGFTTSGGRTIPSYLNRGKVYVGANDGMLHAFNLGILDVTASGDQKAKLSGSGLGNEAWAFIPTNVLPYLKYYADPNYSHLYFIDGNTTVVDASVGKPDACTSTYYWDCAKDTSTGNGTNWRSILVGGMGIGGASRDFSDSCMPGNGGTCVKSPISGVGYSSYYALDVSDPDLPKLLWEFSDATGLGFATSGPAIVKISAKDASGKVCSQGDINVGCTLDSQCATGQTCIDKPDNTKNGKWFAVFGSGPTGPIDTAGHAFKGTSNQPLKVYIVDLNATPPFSEGTNYWVKSTVYDASSSYTLDHAFSGSMVNGAIDVDRWNSSAAGNYQDDAVYFGYSQETTNLSGNWAGSWTKGGVLKLITFEDPNPGNWKLVKVIDGIGPVTTGIGRLQDRKNHKLWLYFGTGRYFYLQDDFAPASAERIYGVQDQCYRDGVTRTSGSISPRDSLDPNCTVSASAVDQTAADQTTISNGWYINLDLAHDSDPDPTKILGSERVITDPVAMTNGAVFFSTYKPNHDFCQYGGLSYLWAVKFDSGTEAPKAALNGKALVQVSTGQFKEVDLSTAFVDTPTHNRRMSTPMTGKPPTDAPPIVSTAGNKPVKRMLHIQER